jgi:hypothetical protein
MKTTVIAVLLLGLVGVARSAGAGDLHEAHTTILSGERLTTVQYSKVSTMGFSGDGGATNIYLFVGDFAPRTPFDLPRLALDYTAADHFTLGGSIGFVHASAGTGSDATLILASPRLGAVLPLTPGIELWGRGGVTYYHSEASSTTYSGVGLNLEAMFVFKIVDHFGGTLGGDGDIGLHDSHGTKYLNFGAAGGLVAWF